jgi:hypothetical protein
MTLGGVLRNIDRQGGAVIKYSIFHVIYAAE